MSTFKSIRNNLASPKSQPPYIKESTNKVYRPKCLIHGQEITNFCKSQQCLQAICPKCFKHHTELHSKRNTYGEYETLENCLNVTTRQISECIAHISHSKSQLQALYKNQRVTHGRIRKQFQEVKNQFLSFIQSEFNNYENEIEDMLRQREAQIKAQTQRITESLEYVKESCKKNLELLNSSSMLSILTDSLSNKFNKNLEIIKECEDQYKDIYSAQFEVKISEWKNYKEIITNTIQIELKRCEIDFVNIIEDELEEPVLQQNHRASQSHNQMHYCSKMKNKPEKQNSSNTSYEGLPKFNNSFKNSELQKPINRHQYLA